MQPTDLQPALAPARRPVLDGFVTKMPPQQHPQPSPRPRALSHRQPGSTPQVHRPSAAPERPFQQPVERPLKAATRLERLQTPLIFLGCILGGFFVQSLTFGLVAVVLYGVVATWRRVPSQVTFLLACISLITTIAVLLVRQNVTLASNFATYTFLLLVLGVIAVTIEARPQKRRRRRTGR